MICPTCLIDRDYFKRVPQNAHKYVCATCLWGVGFSTKEKTIETAKQKNLVAKWIDHGGMKNALLWMDRANNWKRIRTSLKRFLD